MIKKLNEYSTYIFYRFYKIIDAMDVEFWNVFRASSLALFVEIFVVYIIFLPLSVLTRYLTGYDIYKKEVLIVCLIALVIKSYFVIDYRGNWKQIVEKFDQLPESKQKKYKRNFWLFITAIIAILILEFWLLWLFKTR